MESLKDISQAREAGKLDEMYLAQGYPYIDEMLPNLEEAPASTETVAYFSDRTNEWVDAIVIDNSGDLLTIAPVN